MKFRIWDNGNKCAKVEKEDFESNSDFQYALEEGENLWVLPNEIVNESGFQLNIEDWGGRGENILNTNFRSVLETADGIKGSVTDYVSTDFVKKYLKKSPFEGEADDEDDGLSQEKRLEIVKAYFAKKTDIVFDWELDTEMEVISNLTSSKYVYGIYQGSVDDEYSFNDINIYAIKPYEDDYYDDSDEECEYKGVFWGTRLEGEDEEEAFERVSELLNDYSQVKNGTYASLFHGIVMEKKDGKWERTLDKRFICAPYEVFDRMEVPEESENETDTFQQEDIQYVKQHIEIEPEDVIRFLEKETDKNSK